MGDDGLYGQLSGLVALSSGDSRLDTVIRLTCGRALSLAPLPSEADLQDGKSERESVVCAFTEQFAVDVSQIGKNQRKQLFSVLGDKAFRTVAAMFIADFVPRVWAGFDALGMGKPSGNGHAPWDHDTDPADALLNNFVPAVARLRKLDDLTTEIVRLRGAVQHNCRLCQSRREEKAMDAGGSETLYSEIQRYQTSTLLTDRHKAALAYVDALIWTPSKIDRDVVAAVRKHFHQGEIVELTLDVMRNATNKIAVALAADAPAVENGIETYVVDSDGQMVVA